MCVLFFLLMFIQKGRTQEVGDVRLVGGATPLEGRMELYLGARGWFASCDKTWDINDSTVICRQLGYPGASLATTGADFGRTAGNHLLARTWNCTGKERRIGQCPFEPTYACNEIVGVICQDPSYLGCYNDVRGIFDSFLEDDYFVSSSLTVEACRKFCSDTHHPIVGLKNGVGCYCGDRRDAISGHEKFSDAMCQKRCSGNERQICGGARSSDHDSISVFDANLGNCEDPGVPENGARLSDWFHFGDVVTFDCFLGYRLVGNDVIQCVLVKPGDGHETMWNASTPACVESTTTTVPVVSETSPNATPAPSPMQPITTLKTPAPATDQPIKTTNTAASTERQTTTSTTLTKQPSTTLKTSASTTDQPIKTTITASSTKRQTTTSTTPTTRIRPTTRKPKPGTTSTRGPSTEGRTKSVTPSAEATTKYAGDKVTSSKTMTSSDRADSTTESPYSDELFTFYTELYQTEIAFEDEPENPRNGILGIPEEYRTIVSVGGILVACVISILLITVTKRILCRRRRAYHSLNIEHRISEEDLHGPGPYVYEPLTGSGGMSGSGHYARPRRHSLRKGFKRLSRRPWSEMEESRESADEENL